MNRCAAGRVLIACATALLAPGAARGETAPPPDGLELWYTQPAHPQKWSSEALPIGNGRLGAMLFGGVAGERIQFNEISLWGGANNWDGGFDTGDLGFGGYRNFGDLLIDWNGPRAAQLTSPSGHGEGNGQGIGNTVDGQPGTKWCIEYPGTSVLWQVCLPKAQRVDTYTFTSAPDVPERDPKSWRLEGSTDGKVWTELDRRAPGLPFEQRGQTKPFIVATPGDYRFYRFTFAPPPGASHFQISDIALAGVAIGEVAGSESVPADYRRSLDIGRGVHRVSFTDGTGARIQRWAFASRPDQVLVFRYEADRKGALSGSIRLKPGQGGARMAVDEGRLTFSGALANKLRYACAVRVLHTGGSVSTLADTVVFDRCDSLTLLLDARTDYKPSYADGWRGEDPLPLIEKEITAAEARTYDRLLASHTDDFQPVMGGVTMHLGESSPAQRALPTPARLARYIEQARLPGGEGDPGFEALRFQMGRYLLASSSRPGGLPANLQGLWNDRNNPPWASDYHSNINIEMNYWPAEPAGLGECAVPLMDFIAAQAEPCRIATRKAFGGQTRGWTARTSQSPFGGNGWEWNIPSSAWYALHVFDHWDFGRDEDFLRKTAYPILKEICAFWEDHLKKLPDGTLVAPNGWSPEHGPREDGVMHDQQLIWQLFDDYLKAAQALGVDADEQRKVADLQARLAPNKIGKWGQLQEWQADRDTPNDTHRHTSHLFAVYPGSQISREKTPALAAAATLSLKARCNDHETAYGGLPASGKPFGVDTVVGDSRNSWVWPWRCGMFARLGDAERAHVMIQGLAAHNTYDNLFTSACGVYQIDGALGITATMAEMLLQSHAGSVVILPALPQAWTGGEVTGLRARGGFEVDLSWERGKLTRVAIRSRAGAPLSVSYGSRTVALSLKKGGRVVLNGELAPM